MLLLVLILLISCIALLIGRRVKRSNNITFFHPFSEAGGGGERVLWTCVSALQDKDVEDSRVIYIYTKDTSTSDEAIISNAKSKFSLSLSPRNVKFVRLRWTRLIEASTYPFATLVLQCIGGIVLAVECCLKHRPDTVIGTDLIKKVLAYVHYPFISSAMIDRVRAGQLGFNNSGLIGGSGLLTRFKVFYYEALYHMYQFCGLFVDVAMVNSTWTKNHMVRAWRWTRIELVYPPCDVTQLVPDNTIVKERKDWILSLSQFRPEKNHELQVRSFARFLERHPHPSARLILVGGCRDGGDRGRVEALKGLSRSLGIEDRVQFEVEVGWGRIVELLLSCRIGIHTMVDEHFGISIVEFMAAGLLTIANGSGGPKSDIIEHGHEGWLAYTEEEYVECLEAAMSMDPDAIRRMQSKALEKAKIFSSERFAEQILPQIQ